MALFAKKRVLEEEDYSPGERNYYSESNARTNNSPQANKLVVIAAVIAVIIIIIVLALGLFNQKNNSLLYGPDGNIIGGSISISRNGALVSSSESNGATLHLQGNPNSSIPVSIRAPQIRSSLSNVSATIRSSTNPGIHSSITATIDENGNIHFDIDPSDLNIDGYFDENTGEFIPIDANLDLIVQVVVEDPNTGETTIIEIPIFLIFAEFNQNGCIALNTSLVNSITPYGSLSVPIKIKISCETGFDLASNIVWESSRLGNVEIVFGNYQHDTVLFPGDLPVLSAPAPDIYDATIIFTPFKDAAGKKASFTVNFGIGATTSSTAKINFQVPIDNLEQCIRLTPEKVTIPSNQSSASFNIDVSSCHSDSISFSLCENDPNCSGGAEGGIGIGQKIFSLNPKGNSAKNITIQRQDIPGAYGVPIYARIGSSGKVMLEEKLITVEPDAEANLVPDKFVVSLLEGARDSIRVKNNTLTEDVPIEASICALYNSSLDTKASGSNYGITSPTSGSNTWWRDLAVNPQRQSGVGFYQASAVNTLASLDYVRYATQYFAAQKNADIKKAYLDAVAIKGPMQKALDESDKSVEQAKKLKEKVATARAYAEAQLPVNIASMIASLASLAAGYAALQANLGVIQGAAAGINACVPAAASNATAMEELARGQSGAGIVVGYIAQLITTANTIKSTYETIDSLMSEAEEINADGALNSATSANEKLKQAKSRADKMDEYIQKALGAAAVDSFQTASKDHADAKRYLELAQTELIDANRLVSSALDDQIKANDFITIAIQNTPGSEELIIQGVTTAVSLVTMVGLVQAQSSYAESALQTMSKVNLPMVTSAVGTACGGCNPYNPMGCICCGLTSLASVVVADAQAASTQHTLQVASIASTVSTATFLANTFLTVQQLMNDYSKEFADTQVQFTKETDALYELVRVNQTSLSSLPPAISSADWLSKQEELASKGTTPELVAPLEGDFDKERLTNLVSSAVMNGFVNGAYEGGVYTTRITNYTPSASPLRTEGASKSNGSESPAHFDDSNPFGLLENCENTVKLTLPDYIINLPYDVYSPIVVSNPFVSAQWNFDDTKVTGVFESQQAGVTFFSNGLKSNSYGTIELKAKKHLHDSPTVTTTNFGPFNVPDRATADVSFKYHIKFNATQRKGLSYVPLNGNSCIDSVSRGETGNSALPRIVLSWDWNSISANKLSQAQNAGATSAYIGSGGSLEPFIDATQLSILLSKKLGALTTLLSNPELECPSSPARTVLNAVKPYLEVENGRPLLDNATLYAGGSCFLPYTTREYDGKPALYYFLKPENFSQTAVFSDAQRITNANDFINLVDFNANLIRDGFGTDFQFDFAQSYTSKAFTAAPSFTDSSKGARRYFEDSARAFFSSEANSRTKGTKMILPDAGKYRVRMLIDFGQYPQLYGGNSAAAKIIFDLYSLEPVNSNYSPFYYTPFDGFTGLGSINNRRGYGSSLATASQNISLSPLQGAYLAGQQNDSLVKFSSGKTNSFSLLNYAPSLRGKLFQLSSASGFSQAFVSFSPTTATPLLFEINGSQGRGSLIDYGLKVNNTSFVPKENSMLYVSSVSECTDLAGSKLSETLIESPDIKLNEDSFGVALPIAQVNGKTFVKGIAYSPITDSFSLTPPLDGSIYSTNNLSGGVGSVALSGVSGSAWNDADIGNTINSVEKVFSAVKAGQVCIEHSSNSDSFVWPENIVYAQKGPDNSSMNDKLAWANSVCVR